MATIKKVIAREILDSRAHPTIETIVELSDGAVGAYSVPSGVSLGKTEAKELRDGDAQRYKGMGVLTALKNIGQILAPQLIGHEANDQETIDNIMILADNTPDKSNLGANAILALSGAIAKASAASQKLTLYQYIAKLTELSIQEFVIPTPMFNVINGGAHGGDNIDFQEFLIVPPISRPYSMNLRMAVEIYYSLKEVLKTHNAQTLVGDEGGYAPTIYTNADVFKILQEAVTQANYKVGLDIFFSVDVAANHIKQGSSYKIKDRPMGLQSNDLIDFYIALNEQFHLLSLEDPLSEDDWGAWSSLTEKIGGQIMITGDDLITTNLERLKKAIATKACNAVIIKPNQAGTISETIKVVKEAKRSGFKVIVANRSGETNDDFIADLAVGVGADHVKFGAPARGERVAKYNRLLEIEHELSP